MNKRRLIRVRNLILKHHDKLNMGTWAEGDLNKFSKKLKSKAKKMDCGFVGCIVGFTLGAYGKDNDLTTVSKAKAAAKILGISVDPSKLDCRHNKLFIPSLWPRKFQYEYTYIVETWKDITAATVAAVIDDYIATDGWTKAIQEQQLEESK